MPDPNPAALCECSETAQDHFALTGYCFKPNDCKKFRLAHIRPASFGTVEDATDAD